MPNENFGNSKVGMQDFPSLKELETSNPFFFSNITIARKNVVSKIYSNPALKKLLDLISEKIKMEQQKKSALNFVKLSGLTKQDTKK